jgi:AsmA protein
MNKFLKYGLIGFAVLVLLFFALLAVIAFTVNPNDYKPMIVQLVKDKKQRTLTLEGDIKLALFPKLGADLGKISISEHNGTKVFAAMDSARLYVSWLPLLKKELVVDHVTVDGVRVNLVRYPDGTTNFDDLLTKEEESTQVKFDIDGVKVTNAALSFDDQQGGRKFTLSAFNLKGGRLADATPTSIDVSFALQADKPALNIQAQLKSGLYFELEKKHYALRDMNLAVTGEAAGISGLDLTVKGSVDATPADKMLAVDGLKLTLKGKHSAGDLDVKLDAPKLQLAKDQLTSSNILLDAAIKQAQGDIHAVLTVPAMEASGQAFKAGSVQLEVTGKQKGNAIEGKLTGALSGNLQHQQFDLAQLKASARVADPKLPGGAMSVSLTGDAHADLEQQRVRLNVDTRLDDSNIKAKLGMDNFAAPAYSFDVAIDQIDVDRYLPPKQAKSAEPEKPLDLSALKKLNARGSLRIGKLKFSNIKSTNVRVEVQAADAKVAVNPLSANLYKGTLNGSLNVNALATPQFAVKQRLSNISIGPLLRDAIAKDILEGRGSVTLDVTTQGATVSAMKKALNGNAVLNLADGTIKGINVAASLRSAKAGLGTLKGERTQAANQREQTDFSELKASFTIRNGIAHNSDLSAKSPLLRLGGAGDINIGANSMTYVAKATVVGSLEGQGGKELAALKGITVPVRVAGPFDALKYTLDFNALAGEVVKQKVEEKKEELKSKVQEGLKEQLKGLFGR